MQIKQLGYEKQKGLNGQIVNVPIPISKTIRALPRLNHEMETIQLYIYQTKNVIQELLYV